MLRRFYLKIMLLCLPFLLMSATYFVFDPFMVLHKYKRFDVVGAYLNESHVGWENYMMYRDSLGFDSYVMGNSCTVAFPTQEWEKYLNGGKAVRLYDNSETIGGVLGKMEALEKNNASIKNVLIVLDPRSFREYIPSTVFKHILPPSATGMSNMQFQLKNLQGYLYPDIMIPYLHYKITGEVTPYMLRKYIVCPYIIREPLTNNGINPHEKEIGELGEKYWEQAEWTNLNETSDTNAYPPEIFHDQIRCLEKIKEICDKNGADMKLIISPHYGVHIRMNPEDVRRMEDALGEGVVYDLTGKDEFISDWHDYYEPDHYRPVLGARILKYIYSPEQEN